MADNKFDLIIVGGGVVGCAIAREFSKYKIKVGLLEKEADVGMSTSSSNSGVVHGGFSYPIGSLKADVCMRGNSQLKDLCKDLNVAYNQVGKFVIAFSKNRIPRLYELEYIGQKNGADVEIVGEREIKRQEPNLAKGVAALHSPRSAILNPYQLTIAFAENAVKNGAEVFLKTEVTNIKKDKAGFKIFTNKGEFRTNYVINSAGLHSDEIARFSGEDRYQIYPCRGEYHVLDKNTSHLISRLIYPIPPVKEAEEEGGGGIHLTPTVDGNILIGPSDEYLDKREDDATTRPIMDKLLQKGSEFVPKISEGDIIRSYSGIRSKIVPPEIGGYSDFIIEKSPKFENFINLIGIESPGLTASPGIAEYVVNMVDEAENLTKKRDFDGTREGITHFNEVSEEKQELLSRENANYGEIICRCENVTKQEILDALHNPLGVKTLKGIKYRTRATMGRCQGGYCLQRIVSIMQEEGMDISDIKLSQENSNMFNGRVKEVVNYDV